MALGMLQPNIIVFGVWSEWDIGMSNMLFRTQEDAWEAVSKNPHVGEVFEDGDTIQDLRDEGLIGLEEYTLYG